MGAAKFALLIAILFLGYVYLSQNYNQPPAIYPKDEVTIMNWNLQIFGPTKAANQTLLKEYSDEISKYDIVFVQEIRDEGGTAFKALCDKLPQYSCVTTSRAGRTSSKEQYGIIIKQGIKLINYTDFNMEDQLTWERAPVKVDVIVKNTELILYNIHTKPDAVQQELQSLQNLITTKETNSNEKIIILGDLNADCAYFDVSNKTIFSGWTWVIMDNEDTTTSATDCAYDRIILNNNAMDNFQNQGVDISTTQDESDHFPVWVRLSVI